MTKLVLVSKKIESEDKRKCDNSYASSKAEIIINESHIDDVFQPIHTIIITGIQISLGKVQAGLLTPYISISKYNPLAASSYIKLPKELDHSRKGLINIQNTHDNECFKWCFVRYLNSSDHNPRRITKDDKDFAKGFKRHKISSQYYRHSQNQKKNSIGISFFGYENKQTYPIDVSKKKHVKKNMLTYH